MVSYESYNCFVYFYKNVIGIIIGIALSIQVKIDSLITLRDFFPFLSFKFIFHQCFIVSVHNVLTSLVQFISKYFIIFGTIVDGIVFIFSVLNASF
jgi:hypothetical protein